MFSIEHKGSMVHDSSTSRSWAATLRTEAPASKGSWVNGVSKPESTPFRHTKRQSFGEAAPVAKPMTTINVDASTRHYATPTARRGGSDLRPVDYKDEKFSWERTLRSSTQPRPVARRQTNGSTDDRPWRSAAVGKGAQSAPVSSSHTREPSLVEITAAGGHSRNASGVVAGGGHSRRSSTHSRKPSMAMHSRRSTRASIKFDDDADDDIAEEEGEEVLADDEEQEAVEEAATRDLAFPEPEAVAAAPLAVRTVQPAAPDDAPQAVKDTLAGAMLVEQAELIASMTVKQVVEQLATGTTVSKAWVRGSKQRGSTRHVKARVANDLVLLQYPSGFSKRQMTVIVSSIYVTVEPTRTVLTLETDNGTLVIKPYTPEHATLWAFGFNALLHLADKQGMMDENTVISDLAWHGIFQSPKEDDLASAAGELPEGEEIAA